MPRSACLRRLCDLLPQYRQPAARLALLLSTIALLAAAPLTPRAQAQTAPTARLQSHEAIYTLAVDTGTAPAGLAVDATMRMRMARSCREIRLQSGFDIRLSTPNGQQILIAQRMDARESIDGRRYQSTIETQAPNLAPTTLAAVATRSPGQPVAVRFGDGRSLTLPAHTLFSIEHFAAQMAAAAKGEVQISRLVFDGSLPEALEMSTVFGKPRPVTELSQHRGDAIPDTQLYPMRMAMFPTSSKADVPLAEITATTGPTGITARIGIEMAGLRFDGRLTELRLLPDDPC